MRTDPKFEDARGPNVRELRWARRRLTPVEVEALVADYGIGDRAGKLARIYGIHRRTVSARVARPGGAAITWPRLRPTGRPFL